MRNNFKNKMNLMLGIVITTVLFVSACSGAKATPTQSGSDMPDVPTQPIQGTVPTEQNSGTDQGGVVRGGTVIFAHLEPATLNPYIRPDQEAWAASIMVTKGLVDLDPQGNTIPVLASELPSLDKGTISKDGLTVTWKLLPDLKWSDGEPLTSNDLVFTWKICSDLSSGCAQNGGFDKIVSIDTPDDQTAIVNYSSFYPDFMDQFRNGILPQHAVGSSTNMLEWDWNRTINPGNGPFILDEWVPSDHLTFVPNPYYFEAGKPYLDKVIFKIVPDTEVARQMLMSGEIQAIAYVSEPAAIQELFQKGFPLKAQGAWINFLQMNPWDPNDLTKPHPFLGDKRVRQALYMGIDRNQSTYNWAVQGVFEQSLITSLWDLWPQYRCDIPAWPYDVEGAKSLLADAGWTDSNNDGIVECTSCTTTTPGTPFKIRISSYSGWGMEDNEVVIVDMLKKIGVDATVQNYEATTMYSSWADNSFMYRGDFDLLWWDDNPLMPDPQQRSLMWYSSDFIPSENNPTGMNFSRIDDPDIDAWLVEAGSTPDTEVRKAAYCQVAQRVNEEMIVQQANGLIPYVSVTSPQVKGWDVNELYAPLGWDIANWYLEK